MHQRHGEGGGVGGGVGGGAPDQAADQAIVEERLAKIKAEGARDPHDPLSDGAAIEVEPRARPGNLAGARKRSKLRRDVARRQPRQQERGRRDDEDEHQRKQQTSSEKPNQFVTLRLSAFQSTGGRSTDGTTPWSRGLWA